MRHLARMPQLEELSLGGPACHSYSEQWEESRGNGGSGDALRLTPSNQREFRKRNERGQVPAFRPTVFEQEWDIAASSAAGVSS